MVLATFPSPLNARRAEQIEAVNDLRAADAAAGGQGAPLAPLLHRALFQPEKGRRVVLNLGGIANLTLLDADGGVRGFDSGPANCLMDLWIQQHKGQGFDDRGAWASSGEVLPELLDCCLSDPYFEAPPPKSTGLERFNRAWLASQLGDRAFEPRDVQRTLAELTTRTITDSLADVFHRQAVMFKQRTGRRGSAARCGRSPRPAPRPRAPESPGAAAAASIAAVQTTQPKAGILRLKGDHHGLER